MKLDKTDTIVTAWSQGFNGPGWSNRLVLVIVRDQFGKLREESLQRDEQSPDMHTLAAISEAAHHQMVGAVRAKVLALMERAKEGR